MMLHSKNSFDGLQFRIMETIEKVHNTPLSAIEIAARLHDGEYHGELKDTVVSKVISGLHAMTTRGKVVVNGKDRTGRHCYQLPHRMMFPKKENQPVVNPVLKPEVAAAIVPVTPKEKKRPYAKIRPHIIKLLNKAERPLTSREVAEQLAHLYPGETDLANKMGNNLSAAKKTGHVQSKSGAGQGGAQFWFTKRTGKAVRQPELPLGAKLIQPVHKEAEAVIVYGNVPAPKVKGFKPVKVIEQQDSITLVVSRDKWLSVQSAAKTYGVTINEFCIQAIDYAMAQMES